MKDIGEIKFHSDDLDQDITIKEIFGKELNDRNESNN